MSIPHQGHTLSRPNRVNTEAGETGAVYEAQCSCGERFRAASDTEAMVKASDHLEAVGLVDKPPPALAVNTPDDEHDDETEPTSDPVPAVAPESSEPEKTLVEPVITTMPPEPGTAVEEAPKSEPTPRPGMVSSSPAEQPPTLPARGVRSPRRTRR